jgi:hypothetical protein
MRCTICRRRCAERKAKDAQLEKSQVAKAKDSEVARVKDQLASETERRELADRRAAESEARELAVATELQALRIEAERMRETERMMQHADGDILDLAHESMEEQVQQEEQLAVAAEFLEQMLGEKEKADEELAQTKRQLAVYEMELQAQVASASHWADKAVAREEELVHWQHSGQEGGGQVTASQAEELERVHNDKMLEAEQITSGLLRRQEEEARAREEANFAEAEEMVRELAQQKQSAEAEVARMKAKVLRQEEVAQAAEAQV